MIMISGDHCLSSGRNQETEDINISHIWSVCQRLHLLREKKTGLTYINQKMNTIMQVKLPNRFKLDVFYRFATNQDATNQKDQGSGGKDVSVISSGSSKSFLTISVSVKWWDSGTAVDDIEVSEKYIFKL